MNIFLLMGAIASAMAAILHIGCILFGASWYRFFGAGEKMATLAEQGSIQPTLITLFIVLVLIIWSIYALSGAGLISKLPLLRLCLLLITSIYMFRGMAGFFLLSQPMGRTPGFWLWSSAICLLIGLVHLLGLRQTWSSL